MSGTTSRATGLLLLSEKRSCHPEKQVWAIQFRALVAKDESSNGTVQRILISLCCVKMITQGYMELL